MKTVQYRRRSQIFETEFLGTKFVIKRENDNTRKQLLVLEGEVILAFVERGERFSQCPELKKGLLVPSPSAFRSSAPCPREFVLWRAG